VPRAGKTKIKGGKTTKKRGQLALLQRVGGGCEGNFFGDWGKKLENLTGGEPGEGKDALENVQPGGRRKKWGGGAWAEGGE